MQENPVKRKLAAGGVSLGALAWEFVTPGLPAILERAGAEFCIFVAVEGVDVAWVGHGDLSVSMGLPYQFDHPDHLAALDRVAELARQAGKAAGRMVTDPMTGRRWLERGYRMLAYGPETALLGRIVKEGLDDMRTVTRP